MYQADFTVYGTDDTFEAGIRVIQENFESSLLMEEGGVLGCNTLNETEDFQLGKLVTQTVQTVSAVRIGPENVSKFEDVDLNEQEPRRIVYELRFITGVKTYLQIFADVVNTKYVIERVQAGFEECQRGISPNH